MTDHVEPFDRVLAHIRAEADDCQKAVAKAREAWEFENTIASTEKADMWDGLSALVQARDWEGIVHVVADAIHREQGTASADEAYIRSIERLSTLGDMEAAVMRMKAGG